MDPAADLVPGVTVVDPAAQVAAALRDLAGRAPTISTATVTNASPLRVDGVDGDVELKCLGWYDPTVGDQVWVVRFGGSGFVLGAATPNQHPPASGTVTAYSPGSGSVQVSAGGTIYNLVKGKSWTPTVGEGCCLLWTPSYSGTDVQWLGVAVDGITASPSATLMTKNSTTPAPVDKAATPTPATSGNAVVAATQNGTWVDGGWATNTSRLEQGTYNGHTYSAFWFYGGRFSQYEGCTVTAAWIRIPVASAAAASLRLFLHGDTTKAGAKPALSGGEIASAVARDGQVLRVPLPVGAVQQLISGAAQGVALAATAAADHATVLGITGTTDTPRDLLSGAIEFNFERTA